MFYLIKSLEVKRDIFRVGCSEKVNLSLLIRGVDITQWLNMSYLSWEHDNC